jgi:hypothetical protein
MWAMITSRSVRLLAAVLVALSCGLVACGAGPAPALTPTVTDGIQHIRLAYAGGAVTGGVGRYAVPLGANVEIVVASDVADQVHLHGYDRMVFVTAGATATLRFAATLPGVFDVELEQRGVPLAQLQVS